VFCTLLLFGYTSLFLEELNSIETRRELGKKEPGVEDKERRVLGMEEFPVEVIGKIL
jgi:hypothetical protein